MKKIISILLSIVVVTSVLFLLIDDRNITKFTILSKFLSAQTLSEKVVRLHVIANSDDDIDQYVKLKIKDAVLKELTPKLNSASSRSETINIINENKKLIEKVAVNKLKEYNLDYLVSIDLKQTDFPTKYYKDFSLPAGKYLALRVIIGEGEGQNWWCVLFPPLCLVDVKKENVEETVENIDKVDDFGIEKEENSNNYIEEVDDTVEEEQNENEKDQVRIRWKTLEYLGFY